MDNFRNTLDIGTLSGQKAFIRSFVRSIKVKRGDAQMSYTMPLPPDSLPGEPGRVLYSVRYGGAGGIRTPDLLTASQMLSQLSYSPVFTNII